MTIQVDIDLQRANTGADVALISDDKIIELFNDIKQATLNKFKVYEEPTKVIEMGQGNNSLSYTMKRPEALKILSLNIKSSEIDTNNIILNSNTNMLNIDKSQSSNVILFPQDLNSIKVKYLSGLMDKTTTISETTSAVEKGDTTIDVEDGSIFAVNDWIMIESSTPRNEVVKISSISSNTLTIDALSHEHTTEALVTKLETAEILRKYIECELSSKIGAYAIGSTYTFNTSYSKGGVSVNKGVPYTHWERIEKIYKEKRDEYGKLLNNRLSIIL